MSSLTFQRFQVPSFFREFDEMFREDARAEQTFMPAADVRETAKGVELHLDVPGINAEDIDLQVEGQVLTIKATRTRATEENKDGWLRQEREFGVMTRSFDLGKSFDLSKPDARCKNGVLTITVPKKEEVQPKTFKVKVEN